MEDSIANDLTRIHKWAQEKIAQGSEPPWAWYQYMKLIETINALLVGQESTRPMASSPESEKHLGAHLRLVGSTNQQDSARRHPVDLPI
jgi:hypothetical protein